MRLLTILLTILLTVFCFGIAVRGQSALHFSGYIHDDTGRAVSGATLVFTVPASSAPSRGGTATPTTVSPEQHIAVSDGSGAFELDNVGANAYNLCVQAAEGFIDPCQWQRGVAPTELSEQTASIPLEITIPTGRIVYVQFYDPRARVSSPGQLRVIASAADGGFGEAELTSRTKAGLFYRLTVPKGITLLLNLDTQLEISDSRGAAVETGLPTVPVGPQVTQLSFVIN